MQPGELSKLLGTVSAPTLRRWGKTYARFLSPSANPPRGKPRRITEHDARVLSLVEALRGVGHDHSAILARLEAEQANHWENLPPLQGRSPSAAEPSDLPALRLQHQYLQQRNAEVDNQLSEIQARIPKLQEEVERARSQNNRLDQEGQQKIEALQTELQDAKMQAALLKVRLSEYSRGRGEPVNVAVIVTGAFALGVMLAMMLLVITATMLNAIR